MIQDVASDILGAIYEGCRGIILTDMIHHVSCFVFHSISMLSLIDEQLRSLTDAQLQKQGILTHC